MVFAGFCRQENSGGNLLEPNAHSSDFTRPRLKEIQDDLADNGVQLVGINSCRQDSLAEISHFARVTNLEFPLLKDPGNKVADEFGTSRTPEIFIFDADRKLCYRGRIDDQYTYGRQRPKVQREYMLHAIKKIQSDETPEPQTTNPVGCLIGRVFADQKSELVNYFATNQPDFCRNGASFVHRPGGISPRSA